jgi:hypothetical protein
MARYYPQFQTVAFGFACIFAFLVQCQLGASDWVFASDMGLHLGFILHPGEGEAAGYSLLHTVCGVLLDLVSISGSNRAVVAGAVMTVVLVAAFYFSLQLVRGYWVGKYPACRDGRMTALVVAAFVVSMIVLQPWLQSLYLGVFTGNPWHNPTFIFARLFSILTFVSFLQLTDPGARGGAAPGRWWWWFAGSAVLSMWGKPSFMITLGPTFGLVVLGAWLRGKLAATQVWRLAACLLPAVVALLIIRHNIYANAGVANAVVFLPGQVWGQYTPSYMMSVALAAAFPLYVVAVKGRGLSYAMGVATVNWVVSALVFYLLAEAGPRETHANFAWCYMGGLFFFFLMAVEEWFLCPPTGNRWLRGVGLALFAAHLVSGARYLLNLLQGGPYM